MLESAQSPPHPTCRSRWEGGNLWASGLSGLKSGTGDFSGLNSGMGAHSGLNSGTGTLSSSVWHSCRAILSSPSAAVQGAELLSALTLSVAFSLVAGVVAGSRTWSDDPWGSGSVAILSSVALLSDGLSVVTCSGSPLAVSSGSHSAQRGDGGLGTGSGVALHKGGEVLSRTIFGRRRSARDV